MIRPEFANYDIEINSNVEGVLHLIEGDNTEFKAFIIRKVVHNNITMYALKINFLDV